ncbi:hypothetical protein B296_00008575 [Ensete ventricosum]|uniref:Uncharacterized protein n=1 Tax=Ensete ventricosum TaxID=4639 RepID=A0A427BB34_ENSVE|nr:hypothetical protein B296_00008575 [Ensete ventricosum]
MSIAGAAAAATCSLPRLRRSREVVITSSSRTSSRLLSSDWRRSPAGLGLVPSPPLPTPRLRRARLLLVASAVDSTQPSSSSAKTVVPDNEFSVSKVSSFYSPLSHQRDYCLLVRSDVIRYRYGDEQHLDEALKRIFQYGQVTEDGKYCLVLVFEAKALKLSDFEQRQVYHLFHFNYYLLTIELHIDLTFTILQAKFTSFFGPGIIAEIGDFLLPFSLWKGGEADLYEVRLISQTT